VQEKILLRFCLSFDSSFWTEFEVCGHSFDGFVTWWWFGKIKGEGKGALDEDGG
jgi:hypothetical protein